jgi:hypothetical protein
MTSRSLFLAAIVSSTVLAALTGCGKSASQGAAELAIKAASGGKVDITSSGSGDKAQVTIKSDQGTATVISSGGGIPKDFPSDVHLPSAAYTVNNMVQMGPSTVVTLHSAAPVATLFAEYDGAMKSAGWKEVMAVQSAQSASALSFQKDDRVVSVSLETSTDQGGGTNITLQHVAQKPGG